MNTLVRTQGYVTDAHVLEPYAKHSYEIKRYELYLCPSDCTHFYDLEYRIEELKREYEKQQPFHSSRDSNHDTHPALKDRAFDGDCLKFESLHSPRLEGEFSLLAYDDQLIGKFVQVVGHIQIQELGNCFLSFHILEPAVHPAHGWDD
ncbi:hypothetical protein Syn8016DRAFT_1964 [Synechococcus sp. WH 8016]|nr:hypothetical protein Syn8016DRAFT_1964 [Synechococcus sp. WH 8016]